MSLTFYFAPVSTASIIEAVLAELGIPFDLVKLNISVGDIRTPNSYQFFAIESPMLRQPDQQPEE